MSDLVTALRDALAGRYTIDREIGHGGMASVLLAHDVRHDRPVAVKVLHPQIAAAVGSERFLREIQVAARLRHPHILPLFDSGEAAGLLFYVMPYVAGESLRERLRRAGALPLADALRIAREVADALDYAHKQGVVHRDIKPDNILIDDRHALIADFGIARAVALDDTSEMLTSTGLLVGTPAYMSPEQVSGDRLLDGRSDLYALGCVLHEMLTGEPPFSGPTAQAIMAKRFAGAAPAIPADIPPPVTAIVATAMQVVPDKRYGSGREMADALDAAESASRGVVPTPATMATRPPLLRRPAVVLGTAGALVAVIVAAVLLRQHEPAGAAPPVQAASIMPSVGVLPFANRSDSREMEYFSDGVTDELITALSRVTGIQVAGRTSSFSLKGKGLTAQQSADTLHVKLLIDGSVRSSGPSVRVTWGLIDGASGRSLNTGDFDGEMRNVIALQDSLARTIVAQLQPALGITVTASTPRHTTANFEAYNLYLQGHYYWNQRTPASMRRGIAYFRDAIARDSGYALAWAELSSAYTLEAGFGDMRPGEVRDLARAAAERAVRLDSTLSEGYTALGIWHSLANQDWATALPYLDRAVALDSANSFPHLFRTWPLLALGRGEEALAEVRKAVALDPLAPTQNARLGTVLTCLRRYDEAIAGLRRAIELDPSNVQARFELGHAYAMKGRFDEAFKAFPDAIESQAGFSTGWLAASLGRAGRPAQARALYDRLLALSRQRHVTQEALALAALGAGDKSLALDWLERGVREHSFYLVFLNDDPLFDPLRNEPRFQAMLRQLRFPGVG